MRCRSSTRALLLMSLLASGAVWSQDTSLVEQGAIIYAQNCAICHGDSGAGDGQLAGSTSVILQDLRYLSARNDGTFPAEFVTDIVDGRTMRKEHGPEGMPVWGELFAAEEGNPDGAAAKISAIVEFLRRNQIKR